MPIASQRVSPVSFAPAASLVIALTLTACGSEVSETVCADPLFDPGDIVVRWQWPHAAHTQPLVADLDGDAIPEVVVNATRDSDPSQVGALGEVVMLDGATGEEKWRVADDPKAGSFGSLGLATFALADVNGDGALDIIYAGRGDATDSSQIHAVDGAGKLLWSSHAPGGGEVRLRVEKGALAAVNLDDDASAEIVIGAAILDHDGTLVAQAGANGSLFGSPADAPGGRLLYPGGLPALADIDGDGRPEIVTGRDAWRVDWTAGAPPTVTLTALWQDTSGHASDGYPAVADLDDNGTPEVVLTAWPDIRVLDARTGRPWCGRDPTGADCLAYPNQVTAAITIEGGNLGGPPTLADFDGDGRLEAGIASGGAYAVYDFHRPNEEIVSAGGPIPAPGAMYVRWSQKTQDNSSASTGSAVFDLDDDGVVEVFYQDECQLHIFDGATGQRRLEQINSSFTIHEHPIVADVDGDGATEFLVIANAGQPAGDAACKQRLPDFTASEGVSLYGAGKQRWAPTTPLWTQYDFHITNVGPDGNVPMSETPAWAEGGNNSVRQAAAGSCE